jgi:hypothetical protein
VEDQIRHLYLSVHRFDEPARSAKYEAELDEIGAELARGHAPVYAPDELARLRRFLTEGEGWRPRDSYKMVALLAIWLGTPLILVVAAIWLLSSC